MASTVMAPEEKPKFGSPNMLCFGIADWQEAYGISFTQKQIETVGAFPLGDEILNSKCPFYPGMKMRETHFAFVGSDKLNILELQRLNPKPTEPRFYSYAPNACYSEENFANEITLGLRWYLALREVVPNSENKMFDDQKRLLPKEYEVPSAVAETAKNVFIYKKMGVYVNPNCLARTSDFNSDKNQVSVGRCRPSGISFDFAGSDYCRRGLGVAAFRRFEYSDK